MKYNHDQLIERYMGGRMSAAEEREFLSLAGSDERLGHLLDAERAITSGTQKERTRMPGAATSPGAHLLAKLAATPAAAPAAVTGMMALKNGTVQAVIAAVALLGIIIGAIFIAPLIRDENQAAGTAAPAPVVRSAPLPPTPKEEGTAIVPRSVPEPAEGGPAPAASGSVRARKQAPAPDRPAAQEAPQQKTFPLDEGTSPPAVFDNDTVRVEMKSGNEKR